jgi:hypothetical protein
MGPAMPPMNRPQSQHAWRSATVVRVAIATNDGDAEPAMNDRSDITAPPRLG